VVGVCQSYYEGGIVGIDSPYCYKTVKGIRKIYYLSLNCINNDLTLNKEECYLRER
jgi:hypothetical protein